LPVLASRLAHDLRNPLSIMKITVELLKIRSSNNIDEKTREQYERLERAISIMSHQIDGVMDFVRTKPLKLEAASISEIIKSAVHSIKKPKNITIKLPENDSRIICDVKKLEVVFANLILNATQAIDEKGMITILIKQNADYVTAQVEDSGPGISYDIIHKIFDPLFTTKQTGTGLGLSSCKNMVEQHGGTINVTNNPSTFTIILPRKMQPELQV